MEKLLITLVALAVSVTACKAQIKAPVGIFSLTKGDDANVGNDPGWTNSNLSGVAVRATFAFVNSGGPGSYTWTNINHAQTAADKNHKAWAISFDASQAPAWIYGSTGNVAPFNLYDSTTPCTQDGQQIPAPWDNNFQSIWSALAQKAAARYGNDPYLAYITFSGLGQSVESYLAKNSCEDTEADNDGFPDAWITAAHTIIGDWIVPWGQGYGIICFLATGQPTTGDGTTTMTTVANYGLNHYPNYFGLKSCGLGNNYPNNGYFPHTTVAISGIGDNTSGCWVVYQLVGTVLGTGESLYSMLNNGLSNNANAIEVYTEDANDPQKQTVVAEFNQDLITASGYSYLERNRKLLIAKTQPKLENKRH